MVKLIFPLWIVAAVAMFLYSFTQVDLSLTLSQVSIWQGIQKSFQYIGYFNRPLSAAFFVVIVSVMFGLYAVTLKQVHSKKIDRAILWKIILGISLILFFSYSAFSHDIFNYIFDAKILVHYGQNPYEHKALDYPGDPMLSFMHWTHRTYPYGPLWLGLTVPLYFLGFGYFLLTFYLFKLLMVASFVGTAFLIEKIAKKMDLNSTFALAAFALNPLVIIESLVSAHHDLVMVVFALLGILTFLEKKYIKSIFFLVASIAIKYATVLVIPALFAKGAFRATREVFFYVLVVSMVIGVAAASYRTNFQPWYLLFVLPFSAFIQNKYFVAIPVFIVTLFALLQYVPFLYFGDWNPPIPTILAYMLYGSVGASGVGVLGYRFIKR